MGALNGLKVDSARWGGVSMKGRVGAPMTASFEELLTKCC